MRFDAVNPLSMLPAQPTESGTPVLSKLPFLLANVVPMPRLPDRDARPEEKHSKNEYEQSSEEAEDEEDFLPEIFKLVAPPDFRHLFEYYYFDKDRQIVELRKKLRFLRSIQPETGLSQSFKQASGFENLRTVRYGSTVFFHNTRPGARFAGEM